MKRIPSLDGLRAFSIALVVLGHWASIRYHSPLGLSYANLGVRIFFVISGYLITTLLLNEHAGTNTINVSNFYIRRAYRILPAAAVFMFPTFIIFRHDLTWYHVLAATFYFANFDPKRPWFIGHLWSLAVEEQFYLLWPSVLKRWYERRVWILIGAVAICPFYRAFCFMLKFPSAASETFPATADNLAVGCLLAIFAPRFPKIKKPWALTLLFIVALVPLDLAVTKIRTMGLLFLLWPLLQFSIAGLLIHVVESPYKLLNVAPVRWLGRISYSLYLWQQLFAYHPRPSSPHFVVLALAFACASYYFVERPVLLLRDKKSETNGIARQFVSLHGSAQQFRSWWKVTAQ
jgi:peptidoglycan/LPS O-acetylase OafA/YrhL